MDVKVQPILQFTGIDIVNVNATLLNSYDRTKQPGINSTITPKVFFPDNDSNAFTIIVELKVESAEFFVISFVAFGSFMLNRPANDPELRPFININAPAIMFPYVRSFLSTLTANMGTGYPPVILPPHFFQGELQVVKPEELQQTN